MQIISVKKCENSKSPACYEKKTQSKTKQNKTTQIQIINKNKCAMTSKDNTLIF